MNHAAEKLCDFTGKPARIQKKKKIKQKHSADTVSLHMPQPRSTVALCTVIYVLALSH